MTTINKRELIAELFAFIAQRPGFDPRNYGDVASYRADSRTATTQRNAASELLRQIELRDSITVAHMLTELRGSGRLTIDDKNRIQYCNCQYWCTEYRGAVVRYAVSVLWDYFRANAKSVNGATVRSIAKRSMSPRLYRTYFD